MVGAAVIVTDETTAGELRQHISDLAAPVLTPAAVPDTTFERTVFPNVDGPAFLQFSSGTTGRKKGVMLSARGRGGVRAQPGRGHPRAAGRHHRVVAFLCTTIWGLIGCLVLPMLLGLRVVQLDPFEWVTRPVLMFDAIERHRTTLCWMPNFAFHHMMRTVPKSARQDLASMRAFIDCSEPCKPETLRLFHERFAGNGLRRDALQVSYGMAENVFIATQTDMSATPPTVDAEVHAYAVERVVRDAGAGEAALSFVSVGPAIPGTRLEIRDEAGAVLPDDRVGEIAVTSPYLFKGYYRRAVPTDKLVDGWYMSGDLGFMRGGELFVCGRKDDLLIVNGRNIYAHDVEYAVNQETPVKPGRCVAVGPFNPKTGSQSLVLIAEATDPDPAARKELARAIRVLIQTLFGVAPFDVLVTDTGWLIKTTSGKISRDANTRKYSEQSVVRTAAPASSPAAAAGVVPRGG